MILLDTHAWVWWVGEPKKLSATARQRIDRESSQGRILVSAISAWEVALLVKKGRLALTLEVEDWLARCQALPFFEVIAVDAQIAVRSVNLPAPLHDDPADRILLATALTLGTALVTKDQKLHGFPGVETLW